jgi:RNA polymerase sigma factor FliA
MHKAIAHYANNRSASPWDDDSILRDFSGIVNRVARRLVARTGLQSAYDDLWSAGALGLLEAGRRFDASRGVSFATFAEHRVRGAMLDELRRLDHLPRRLRSRTDDVTKARKQLSASLGREATVEELATELGVEVQEAGDMCALLEPPLPLDSILPTLAGADSADAHLLRNEAVRRLTQAVEKLPERLATVLSLHYVEGFSYREIGELLGVSEPRVCQLHGQALEQLRGLLVD